MRPIIIFTLVLWLASCSKEQSVATKENKQTNKTEQQVDIRLAILPTLDCLPFVIAKENGIYDSIGLNVKIFLYQSQLNAEKALEKNDVDACASDLFRIALLQFRKIPVKMFFSTNRDWHIVANKALRINQMKQIGGRIIAITRHSVNDRLCDEATIKVNETKGPTLKAQINNISIRKSMLLAAQVDAAVLPQPSALVAETKGHTCLYKTGASLQDYAGLAVQTMSQQTITKEKLKQLREGYDLAVIKLIKQKRLAINRKTQRLFALEEVIDSILPQTAFKLSSDVSSEKAIQAVTWLKNRNQVPASYTPDTLLYK